MEPAIVIALLAVGAVAGSIITAAWLGDRSTIEPTEHGDMPL